ncbi:bifunctional UDP-N-acetylglucosamine diphosphorylase/glucosamine-1-phosphate N-acetyltransferase GlmU [Actinocrinis puniceicyclus]|uniref:bifunctional UDP-N-acetylglucosamine diphosphorylase/glucosamine-1-phosphate N-acetyltransferase GlmU n=1 Tax=Actinocrinis puniceicyclus TaxID=977794 RepID=UPI0028ABDD58|nr:bifunctional UDP-N-acetylglucosamine diphosphorylase/glucosamine-1-phosphate N-acetyltransferase GlmU [Actinocrinis puniceicyclus]
MSEPTASAPVRPAAVLILAAGEGKRMRSATPKVLHTLCGRTMLGHVVAAARELAPERLVVVVGHGREQVSAMLAETDAAALPVVQEVQHGTGHAVRIAMEAIAAQGAIDGTVLVTYGDTPLLTAATLDALVTVHQETGNAVTVLTANVPDPTGYGRIVRRDGAVERIVEQRDASPQQAAIREVNSGVYAFDAKLLAQGLSRLTTANAQGEEYLTDVLGILAGDGHRVGALTVADHHEILGANDRAQLAQLRRIFNARLTGHWMREGVTIVDPDTTWIDVQVALEPDVVLLPNTQLCGATRIAVGAEVGPNCTLTDTVVGSGARVTNATTEGAVIGEAATVGPYTYLRPGTRLGRKAKAGGFVEMKNAQVGDGSKVPHLSYVGDATIGEGCNIGAGTITANFDGVRKHHTRIGDHVFVGTDTVLIAPVQVADGAFVAAGSAITQCVPAGSLAVARGRQRNVEGWVERTRPDTKAARAAQAAQEAHAAAQSAEAGEPAQREADDA